MRNKRNIYLFVILLVLLFVLVWIPLPARIHSIFLAALSVLPFLLIIFMIFMPEYQRQKTLAHAPELRAQARALSKTTEVVGRHTVTNYYISFELEDGKRINVSANVDQYNIITENDTGLLVYKEADGKYFLSDFQR